MFDRRNIDDIDDYRREQEDSNREKNTRKLPKLSKKTNSSGNIVYLKSYSAEMIFTSCLIIAFFIMMIAMMVTISGISLTDISGDVFIAIGFAVLFFVIFYLAMFGLAPKARQIELSINSIICVMPFNRKIEIPYSEFIELECRRTYGKNHQYTGTRYLVVYREPNGIKERKIYFQSINPLDASDFNYEVQKRLSIPNSPAAGSTTAPESPQSQQFLIPQSKNANMEKITFLLIFPVIAFIIMAFIYGLMISKSEFGKTQLPFVIMFFVVLIVFITMSSIRLNNRKWDKTPEMISFEPDGMRVNDKYFSSASIRRLYVTPIGRNNPRALNNSTIDIITDDTRYSYNLGLFFIDRYYASRRGVVAEWSFDAFYYCAQQWCAANQVEMVDFLI